ncbi:MAG TPA: DUF655 domain-containing protein [Burkholderiaceae bacterium]|nr:DUF655 domain-containing protein [Burkholderiaceae bacterium]
MNPFLESTVATPQPGAQWRSPSPSRKPGPGRNDVGRRQSGSAKRASAGRHRGRAAPLRSLGGTLRMLVISGSLLMPGLLHAVDINTASLQQLQEVKGIGPKTASLIIEERDRGGKFESMKDVSERVKGIGPKKAAALETAGLKVGGAAPVAAKDGDTNNRPARRAR